MTIIRRNKRLIRTFFSSSLFIRFVINSKGKKGYTRGGTCKTHSKVLECILNGDEVCTFELRSGIIVSLFKRLKRGGGVTKRGGKSEAGFSVEQS